MNHSLCSCLWRALRRWFEQGTLMSIRNNNHSIWAAPREFGTYRLCEQRRFRRACASAQSRQNLRCSLIQAVNQEEPSDRKPDPWPLWIAGHAQLKFVMTDFSKTQICLMCHIMMLGFTGKMMQCWWWSGYVYFILKYSFPVSTYGIIVLVIC